MVVVADWKPLVGVEETIVWQDKQAHEFRSRSPIVCRTRLPARLETNQLGRLSLRQVKAKGR